MDSENVQYLKHLSHKSHTIATAEAWITRCQDEPSSVFLTIIRTDDGENIGDGGYEGIDVEAKTGDAGVMLSNTLAVRGKGYAVEAMDAIVQFGFDVLGLQTVTVTTLMANESMRGLMERRFKLEPEIRTREDGSLECRFTIHRTSYSPPVSHC